MFVDLPSEEEAFEILEGEVIELEDSEVALNPPWISVLFEFALGDFAVEVTADSVE